MPPAKKKAALKKEGPDQSLRKHFVELLQGGNAHVGFSDAIADFPADKRGAFAQGLAHTGWQLLEHLRIAQWDILEFSRNSRHVSPEFPEGYWPKTPLPPGDSAWNKSVKSFQRDLQAMIALVSNPRSTFTRHSLGAMAKPSYAKPFSSPTTTPTTSPNSSTSAAP